MTEDGEFVRVRHGGVWYSGKSLMDYSDMVVKNAWAKHDESALDMMWYLWCGNDSPFSAECSTPLSAALSMTRAHGQSRKTPISAFGRMRRSLA